MKNKNQRMILMAIGNLAGFVLWTILLSVVDVQHIGPQESAVGFATVNGWFHDLTGVHMELYVLTDWLSLIPLGIVLWFAILGLSQWIRRRSLRKVDADILLLGGFYGLVLLMYVLFEGLEINYRPVLIDGFLEASYPSSTTMLVLCVMLTAVMEAKIRIQNPKRKMVVTWAVWAFTVFMVVGRLISGVHWLTDIIGGILLSNGLVLFYCAMCGKFCGI